MTVSGADGKDEKFKVALLLHTLREEALDVYNTFDITKDEESTLNDILGAFRSYRLPKKNKVFERYPFWAQPMHVTELRQKSKVCEFGVYENDMTRDKIVFSMYDQRLKERLLRGRCCFSAMILKVTSTPGKELLIADKSCRTRTTRQQMTSLKRTFFMLWSLLSLLRG